MKHRTTILSLCVISCLTWAGAVANAQKENPPTKTEPAVIETNVTSDQVNTEVAPDATPTETANTDVNISSKRICKNIKMEGTRLRKRKVCKTQELWDAERKAMNDELDKSRRAVYTGS